MEVEAGLASAHSPSWSVLLIGGASGTGKSTVARQIGRDLGMPWYQVDDLRLALQWMEASLPAETEALQYFAHIEEKPHIWKQPPEALCGMLIAVGHMLRPAIAAIIDNHISQNNPIVIEGDGILPSLLDHRHVGLHVETGKVSRIVLAEPDQATLLANMRERNRGQGYMTDADVTTEARAKWLFAEWLAQEAARRNVPVVESRPWEALVRRVLDAASRSY